MIKKKLAYEAPETHSFVLRFEGMVCASSLQSLTLMSIGGADQGFGDSAASIDDKSSESWW